ncbi:MAG: N-acetyltransferase [Sphingobacteriaceae bacterium]|nr:N-acetyltransferase [Sphingobacteriaceae bacterium]
MKVEFKYAELQDLERIVETYNESIPGRMATADTEPVSVESKLGWFESHNTEFRPIWLVILNDYYAGWMSFSTFYGRPAYSGTVEISIYIKEDFQNRGLGKICLQYAMENAHLYQVHTLLGFIFGHNESSIALFKKFNFEEWGHLPGLAIIDGTPRDLVILGKKIFN